MNDDAKIPQGELLFLWHPDAPHPARLFAVLRALKDSGQKATVLVNAPGDRQKLLRQGQGFGVEAAVIDLVGLRQQAGAGQLPPKPPMQPSFLMQDRQCHWNIDQDIGPDLAWNMAQFDFNRQVAALVLRQMGIRAVIYDIEYAGFSAAFISAARSAGIPVVSMQHAGGDLDQYAVFPVLADYFIAYSGYNRQVLIDKRQIDPSRIWLTGLPDLTEPDITPRRDTGEAMTGTAQKPLRILASLRTYSTPDGLLHRDMVAAMLSSLKAFDFKPEFEIHVRQHPRDLDNDGTLPPCDAQDMDSWIFDQANQHVYAALEKADIVISLNSAVVLDSMAMGIPVLIIDCDDHGSWPAWSDGEAYRGVSFADLPAALDDIIAGQWPLPAHREKSVALCQRFDTNSGPAAARRVADHLAAL